MADVSKSFAGIPAVANVSLAVERGELFALLGASGSGKTTLLRLIAGLETPDSGRIRIAGRDVTETPAYTRPVNTVFQSYALFPHMSVRANIAFGLKQEPLPSAEIVRRIDAMLALVQMTGFADRRPHQLSGGQKQRVALARSLAKQPELLLLDEPMAALDRKLREQTRLELAAIQRRLGITFILVTHDQDEAMSLADRMAVMEAGRIVQIGTPRDIYDRPASRFVASFIGQTNLFEARVRHVDGRWLTVAPIHGGADMRVQGLSGLTIGDLVWVSVRPERMNLGKSPHAVNLHQGVARQIEFLGDMSLVHVVTEYGQRLRVAIPHRSGPEAVPQPGDTVCVWWPAEAGVVLSE